MRELRLPFPEQPRFRRVPRSVVRVEIGPRNTTRVHGLNLRTEGVTAELNAMRLPYMRDTADRKVICIPTNRASELIAWLENRKPRRPVEVSRVTA